MKTTAKYIIFSGLWLVLLIPFYVSNSMFFPYITGKNFAFRIIIEIIFALWVYLAYFDKQYRPKFSWMLGSIAIFVAVLLAADIFAVAPMKALWSNFERMDGWVTQIHLLMYFFVLGSMFKSEKNWLAFFRTSLGASFIMVILAISQWLKTGEQRVDTTLGNTIYVAVYFLFNFFIALILLYKEMVKNGIKEIGTFFSRGSVYIYGISAILSLFGIWRTGTRGAIVGLFGGFILSAIIIAIFEKENKLIKKSAVAGIVIILILIGGFFAVKNADFVKKSSTLNRLASISWSNTDQGRQIIWPMALKGFKEKPILGWGQDGFNYVFNKYYDVRMYNHEQWFDRAHDMPLDIMVAAGILGLISYLAMFGIAVMLIWKRRKEFGITQSALLVGLLAAYFFNNIFVFDNLISYVYFIIILGYIHANDVENKKHMLESMAPKEDIGNYVVAPILVVVLVSSLWYANYKPIVANISLIQALQGHPEGAMKNYAYIQSALDQNTFASPEIREQLWAMTPKILSSNQAQNIKNSFAELSVAEIDKQIKQTPKDSRYLLFAGSFYNNIGQSQLALPLLEKAVENSPLKQTMLFELSKTYAYLGQREKALEVAKRAYEEVPEYQDAKDYYIGMLFLNDKNDLARQLMGSTTTNSEIVIRVYLIRASEFLQKGDKASAVAEVRKAIQLSPAFKEQGEQIIQEIYKGNIK